MIAYFPNFYPDELVYSLLSRYYAKSGYLSYTYCAQDLYRNKKVKPDIEFLNKMTTEAYTNITHKIDIRNIVTQHTMFMYYGRFIPPERRRLAFEDLVNMKGNHHDYLCIPKTNNARYLRYCPECVKEDRDNFGEIYWHRKHQMIGVNICHKHFCKLEDSSIIISGKATPSLQTAEESITDATTVFSKNRTEKKLVMYISEVMDKNISLDNNISIGQFINSKLQGTKYIKSKVRNMRLLTEDFNKFYSDLNNKVEPWQIQKILTGYKMYDICMLAMFLEISADEICNMILPESVNKISRQRVWSKKPGVKSRDWNKIDTDLQPKIKQTVKEIYGIGEERPKKVSKGAVSKKLSLPDKYIINLPKCMNIIEQYSETQEEYWAREIAWAVKKLVSDNKVLNWKNIRNLINISREDLDRAWKYIDSDTKEFLKELI